ncbi:MAG TPA: hypothetical protein VFV10_12535 [Gammaproteobacteria bacterium]|nr:hypothetical protein [Gammaproteobacteria bacterium]
MARPRIVEVDYFPFQQALRRAIAAGERIEPSEKERWEKWVREHRVKEAAFRSFGKSKGEDLEPVIIDTEGQWRGYYLVSTQDEVCLKWAREDGDS